MIKEQTPLFNNGYRIIVISGKALSSKDTVARLFIRKYNFVRISFADDVKNFGGIYFGLTREEMYVQKTVNSRNILQGLGSMLREEIDQDYWIDRVHNKIKKLKMYRRVVIPDCRYLNEMNWVISHGGVTIRVHREDNPPIEVGEQHSSEIELDSVSDESWDYHIYNQKRTGWEKALENQVDNIAINLRQKEWLY